MPAKPKAPVVLGPEWEKRLRSELRRLADLRPLCDQTEQIGVDCGGYRAAIDTLSVNIQTMLDVFFPKK